MLRKDSGYESGPLPEKALQAFNLMKQILISRPCLKPINFNKPFILTVDSCKTGVGAILSQIGNDGVEHPVCYASKTNTAQEQKRPGYLLEAYGLEWACKTFRCYLIGGKTTTIRVDCKALIGLNKSQGQALERIQGDLQEYLPYEIEYLKGDKMPADGLSRVQVEAIETETLKIEQLWHLQKEDKRLKSLACRLKYGLLPHNEELRNFTLKWEKHSVLHKGIVCYKLENGSIRYFAPKNFIPTILYLCHNSIWAGHYNDRKTLWKVQQAWFWPNMITEVTDYCKQCPKCNEVNNPHMIKPAPLQQADRANKFNYHIHIDLLTNLPTSIKNGNKHLAVITDQYSKYTSFFPIADKTPLTLAKILLQHWIPLHSLPQIITSDAGSENHNKMINNLTNILGIEHNFSSIGYARSNSEVETRNKIFLHYCRKYLNHNEWEDIIPHLQFAYNSQQHSTTKHSPFFLAFNRHPVLPHHVVIQPPSRNYADDEMTQQLYLQHKTWQDVLENSKQAFLKNKNYYDKAAQDRQLNVGDLVYLKTPCPPGVYHKFHKPLSGPFTVVERKSNNNYVLMNNDGKLLVRNLALIRAAPAQERQCILQPRLTGLYKPHRVHKETRDEEKLRLPKTEINEQKVGFDWDEEDNNDTDHDDQSVASDQRSNVDEQPSTSSSRGLKLSKTEKERFSYPQALTRLQSRMKKIPPVAIEIKGKEAKAKRSKDKNKDKK